jgi:hypothetical protein
MRTQSKTTTITYAGRAIVDLGDTLDGESFSGERTYTTTTTPLVMSAAPALDNYGNASGRQEFTVSRDFATFEDLLEYLLEAQNFADDNQTGRLSITVGSVNKTVSAGLASLRYEITLVASFRLALTWDFLLI